MRHNSCDVTFLVQDVSEKSPGHERGSALKYVSTRGEAPALLFEGALLAGLACDGGLYVPETWPKLDAHEIAELAGLGYA